jgi:GTP-binding protein EngB required for normal cell division/membrane protein implicated in regulation of membrane protease activity
VSLLTRRHAPSARAPVPARLAALAAAVDTAEGHVEPHLLEGARTSLARAGERLRLSGEHTVVALAGATGSGKSSLFNALAGLELSRVGVRRPTTSSAHACVWDPEGAGPLLEWLGIPRRHQIARESALDAGSEADLRGLVLLDLPDHDSTALDHRLEVDRLVKRVDLLVWVVDPQKYADAALHDRYLRSLAAHGDVTVVVLNQVDTLPPEATSACLQDLQRLLAEDGLAEARVLAASTQTGSGVPELRAMLVQAVRDRAAATARIAADLDGVVDHLAADLDPGGVETLGATGRGRRPEREPRVGGRERDQLVAALAAAAGVPVVANAVERSHRSRAVRATGLPWTRWMRGLRPDPLRRLHLDRQTRGEVRAEVQRVARSSVPVSTPVQRSQVDTALRRLSDAAADGQPPAWREGVRRAARSRSGDLPDALDRAVVSTDLGMSTPPRWWTVVGAMQWLLAAATLVGALWLTAAFVVAWLQLPALPLVEVTEVAGGLPLPTLLLVGGLVAGVLLAAASRWFAAVGARRRRRRAQARLRQGIERVADELVLAPVQQRLDAAAEVRTALARARG